MLRFDQIPPENLVANFQAHQVPRNTPAWYEQCVAGLNDPGFVTFGDVGSPAEFLGMVSVFGDVRRYSLTDEAGITTMVTGATSRKQVGAVTNPAHEQPLHTDGSTMPKPADVVAIYCKDADPHVVRANVFGRAAVLFAKLIDQDPDLLARLRKPVDCGDTESAVFTTDPTSGLTRVRFRQVPPVMGYPPEVLRAADKGFRAADVLIGITLAEGRGVLFNNNTLVHGVGASKGPGRVALRAMLTIPPDSPIQRGFRAPLASE
jgi:hypothetical protein